MSLIAQSMLKYTRLKYVFTVPCCKVVFTSWSSYFTWPPDKRQSQCLVTLNSTLWIFLCESNTYLSAAFSAILQKMGSLPSRFSSHQGINDITRSHGLHLYLCSLTLLVYIILLFCHVVSQRSWKMLSIIIMLRVCHFQGVVVVLKCFRWNQFCSSEKQVR